MEAVHCDRPGPPNSEDNSMFRPTLTLPLLILATMTISSAQTPATLPSSGCDCASLARIDAPEPAQKAADSVSPLLLRPSPSVSKDIPPAPSSNADMSPAAPNNKKLSWRKTLGSKAVLRQVLRSVATQYTLVRMGMGSGLMNIPAPVPANANGMPLPPGLPGPQGPIQNVYPAIATNVPYGYAPQGPGALPPTQGPVVASSTGVGLTLIPWQVSQPGIAPAAPTQA